MKYVIYYYLGLDNEQITDSDLDEDFDDEDKDKTYEPPATEIIHHSSKTSSISSSTPKPNDLIEGNITLSTNHNVEEIAKPLTRKRLRNESNWGKNIQKKLKNEGKEYVRKSNLKVVPAKKVGIPCGEKCRLKCANKLTLEQRSVIHNQYWKIGDINRQREFIMSQISPIIPKYRSRLDSNRSLNYSYKFEIDDKSVRVCKPMFMSTLDISSRVIFTATKKMSNGILEIDQRGRHGNLGRKVDDEIKEGIRNHIKSFASVPSHYCRANSTRQYIDGSLNISIMYKLYVEKCNEENVVYGKKNVYDSIFNQEFNISFFKPKKDLCMCCEAYKNKTESDDNIITENYEKHQQEKNLCRQEKEKDISDENNIVGCFDLQAVLITPRGEISQFYYKRRLACYNFTIYNIKDRAGICYFWHEAIAKRGSNEIGSCLYQYIKSNQNESKNMVLYCDNCGGQNKNKFVVSILIYCAMTLDIKSITLKFFTVGHSQNEGDSMHARIENEANRILKGGPIYQPSQWVSVIKCAKKNGKPYTVYEMQNEDFFDLKKLSSDLGNNFNINEDGEKVLWQSIKVIQIEKINPTLMKYKTSYSEELFQTINIRQKMRKPLTSIPEVKTLTTPVKISIDKKKDLLSLCHSNAIPKNHWAFYESLQTEETTD